MDGILITTEETITLGEAMGETETEMEELDRMALTKRTVMSFI